MKGLRTLIFLLTISTVFWTPAFVRADSLWQKAGSSPYSTERSYKIGDVIYIIVLENTSALTKAGTDTQARDDLSVRWTNTVGRLAPVLGTNEEITGAGENKYRGAGATTRASQVKAKVAGRVEAILPNGQLKISAAHHMSVNDEVQDIYISGVVRAKDVTLANTIYSHQVANADVRLKGTGVVDDASQPGWFTRILNFLF